MKAYKIDLRGFAKGKVREYIARALIAKGEELGYKINDLDFQARASEALSFEDDMGLMHWSNAGDKVAGFDVKTEYDAVTPEQFLAFGKEDVQDEVKPEFEPFQKVLVRDLDDEAWSCDFFSHTDKNWFVCAGTSWRQCIPYEGNEHLVGKTEAAK